MSYRVLIACEESQVVCKAFRDVGCEAFSCDIQPCSGGHPEWHINDDVLKYLDEGWDLMIAHPPCTFLTKAGATRMFIKPGIVSPERLQKALEAKQFFFKLLDAPIPRICIENPTPLKIVGLPEPSMVCQPFEFGDFYSKRTCFWLKNLPPLYPTLHCMEHSCYTSLHRSAKIRSKTFPGIAKAMAEQWSFLEDI